MLRHLHRTGGSGRRGGCRNSESTLRIAGPDGRMAAGLRLGAGKGLEFNVAAEAAARAPDLRESWLGRRCAACPGPVIYCPGAKGAPTGPEVDYTQCASSCGSGARRPHGLLPRGRSPSSSVLLSEACGSRKRDTGGRLGPGSGRLVGHPISS